MDYDELVNRVFRKQPVDGHSFFTLGQGFVGCHDPVMEKIEDIV